MGTTELLLLLLVGGGIYLMVAMLRRMTPAERLLARRAEHRLLIGRQQEAGRTPVTSVVLRALAIQLSVLILIVAIMIAGRQTIEAIFPERSLIDLGAGLLGVLLMFAGVVSLWARPFDRNQRYSLLIAGSTLSWVPFVFDVGKLVTSTAGQGSPTETPTARAVSMLVGAGILAVSIQGVAVLLHRALTGPTARARRLYRWTMRLGRLFAISSLPVLPVYLLFRYHLVECMSANPILYFRSFHHQEIATGFGRIVAPVASRFSVVKGLVHPLQPPTTIYAATSMLDRARFEIAPDENWQAWVQTKLESCTAVIVDATVQSDGLTWELSASVAAIGAGRIAVLVGPQTQIALDPGVARIEYSAGEAGIRGARRQLESWLARVAAA